ncbi:MAG: YjcZ family sporulation protein [Erysipelotrichaceae bacterium]|nr:YjcZ family sporulation protein [Erysipelotrichaceae bacterium]
MNPTLGYQNGGFGTAFAFILVLFILIAIIGCFGCC